MVVTKPTSREHYQYNISKYPIFLCYLKNYNDIRNVDYHIVHHYLMLQAIHLSQVIGYTRYGIDLYVVCPGRAIKYITLLNTITLTENNECHNIISRYSVQWVLQLLHLGQHHPLNEWCLNECCVWTSVVFERVLCLNECCVWTSVVFERVLCLNECCVWTSVVFERVLCLNECCVWTSVVFERVLCLNECCVWTSVVFERVLCLNECCVWTSVVFERVLCLNECCVWTSVVFERVLCLNECCVWTSVVFERVLCLNECCVWTSVVLTNNDISCINNQR